MIEINLLPEHLRKKQLPLFTFNLGGSKKIIGIALCIVVLVHLFLQVIILFQGLMLGPAEKAFAAMEPQRLQVDELKAKMEQTKVLEELLARFNAQRFSLSPKLNAISDSVTEGLWLYELVLSRDACELKGSCVSLGAQELAQIGKFLNNLRALPELSKAFPRLELVSVQRRKVGAVEVVDFIISSKSQAKPGSGKK